MPVSKRLRYEILRRDKHTCRYCGAKAPDVALEVDHVTPEALGGSNDPSNLVTACEDCNAGKSSTSPDAETVADVDQKAAKWSEAMKRAAEKLAEVDDARDAYIGAFLDAWPRYMHDRLPRDFDTSVGRLYDVGLPESVMIEAAWTAATNRGIYYRFAYFMGICWKRVTAMQEIAGQILEDEGGEPGGA